MNYYEQHLGDYARDTMHLSMTEHGAYRQLLDRCYASEKPLPSDVKKVRRLAGARTPAEQRAVDVVLEEFFVLEDDGWHNPRCDTELARYWEGKSEREAAKEGEESRAARHREERKAICDQLRQAGIRFPWNAKMSDLRALLEQNNNGDLPSPVTAPETAVPSPVTAPSTAKDEPVTATQYPTTNNQTPEEIPVAHTPDTDNGVDGVRAETAVPSPVTAPSTASSTELVTAPATAAVPASTAEPTQRAKVGMALKAAGADMARVNTSDPRLDALLAKGATPEQFAGLWREAQGKGIKSPWPWVLTVLPERIQEAKALAAAQQPTGLTGGHQQRRSPSRTTQSDRISGGARAIFDGANHV